MSLIINDLLEKNETVWLEFKSFWYWNEGDDTQKGWGEFLKDFVAIFNTYSIGIEKKYFIIGFNDATKEKQAYDIDKNGTKLTVFNDLEKFKKKIVTNLKKHFKNLPEFQNSFELNSIEDVFIIEEVNYENNISILLITFFNAPYLLELKQALIANESFRSGNIITRIERTNGSPENTNANPNLINELLETVEKIRYENYPEKIISIKKIVDIFKERNFPSSNITYSENEESISSGKYYEIYKISGEYSNTIEFIYIPKYTIQVKILEYLEAENILEKNSYKIVFVDEWNKNKGRTDKKNVQKLFEKIYSSKIEIYYIQEFAIEKLLKNLLHSEIFHQGNFDIKDFIKPFTDITNEKTADLLLKEWYGSHNMPLLVMKGMGGIGKTTVIKHFLDELYKELNVSNKLRILFINSHEIIDDIMKNPKIDNLFDFYRIIAERQNIKDRFDKKLLELSIDSGNIIIVLDGLDEVIAKMGSKFNINNFITSIFKDYSENIGKTKIIITCRDYFWDKNNFQNIVTMSLEPFTISMAEKYFKRVFTTDSANCKNAIKLANEFALEKDNSKIFIPYVLDMIKENLLTDSSKNTLETNLLIPENITNDYIIAKACQREIIKLSNLCIDEQVKVFIHIAVKYNGVLHKDQFPKINSKFQNSSSSFIEKFNAHPLLEYRNDILKFRYDFFNEFFKNIKIVNFIKKYDFDNMDKDLIEIFIQHISYDGSLSKDIKKRLIDVIDYEQLKFSILQKIEEICLDIVDYTTKRLISSFFILLLLLRRYNNIDERTELLKEIFFNTSTNEIRNFCLINFHTTEQQKPIFNFQDFKFDNCHFENYEYFTECKFSKETFFINTEFKSPLYREGVSSNLDWNNIDTTTCIIEGISVYLEEKQKKYEKENSDLRKDLKQIIKFFWSGSAFKEKGEEEVFKRLRDYNLLIEKMLKLKIIQKNPVTTKQKRNDYIYKVDSKYSNLRKIMEENETCYEFEDILDKISK